MRNSHFTGLVLAAASLAMLIFAPSCGTMRGAQSPGSKIDANPPVGLQQLLPKPDAAARKASAASIEQDGSGFDTGLPNQRVTASAPMATFAPDWDPAGTPEFGGLAYAIYSFNMFEYFGDLTFSVRWNGADPASGTVWLGLANFAKNRWDWFAIPPTHSVAFSPLSDYRQGFTMLAAVVVTGTAPVELRRIWLGQQESGYFETEDNDTYETADALPSMPFPPPVVNGSIGTGAGYPGYDGDSSDWFVFSVATPGVASIGIELNKISGTNYAHFDFFKDDGTGAPKGWYGFGSEGRPISARLYFPTAGTYWLNVTTNDVIGDYSVTMDFGTTSLYETEDNDSWEQADPLPALPVGFGQVFGSVGTTDTPDPDDAEVVYDGDNEDWFSFEVPGRTLVAVESRGVDESTDHELYMPDGTTLIASLTGVNKPDKIVAMLPAAGTYFVRVMKSVTSEHANYYLMVKAGDTGMGWLNTTVVDDTRPIGSNACSLCEVDGRPAVAFYLYEDPQDRLCYVRAEDAEGAVWGAVQYLDTISGSGAADICSLAIINGNPAIAYANYTGITSYRLEYIRAADAQGGTWSPAVLVDDSTSRIGSGASLAEVNGKPAISYYEVSPDKRLHYVQAADSAGDSWGAPIDVASAGGMGGAQAPTALRVVDGKPAIAYTTMGRDLDFVRAADADGATWEAVSVLYSNPGQIPDGVALAVVNGKPAVAFSAQFNLPEAGNHIRYLQATDSTGSAWGVVQDLYASGDLFAVEAPSMAVVGGVPVIAFHCSRLEYLWARDADGAAWHPDAVADSSTSAGCAPSLAVVNGHAAIAHRWEAINSLKYSEYF